MKGETSPKIYSII